MYNLKKSLLGLFFGVLFCTPSVAYAGNIVDALNLSPFVPMVLDAFMMVATGTYQYFVESGVIQLFIWIFLGWTIVWGLLKMYYPKTWLGFFGISGGGDISGDVSAVQITENILRPGIRAVIAIVVLLQIKPVYLTQWLVNPFLQLGASYTHVITDQINESGMHAPEIECPPGILEKDWISSDSCKFLTQPVSDLSHANNQVIKRGFEFFTSGLRGLITLFSHGGEDFMNLITGILLIVTFVASNLFMALLVIKGIFDFGMQLILYPFNVLTYVVRSSDKWFDLWPAFSGITKALQQLIVTMIACAFILCINLAVIKALFQWNSSVFVVAAGGSAHSNIPTMSNSVMGFGEHSVMWLSAILTFYLMFQIFNKTQEQLNKYVGGGMDSLYKQVTSDAKTLYGDVKSLGKNIGTAIGWIKGKK